MRNLISLFTGLLFVLSSCGQGADSLQAEYTRTVHRLGDSEISVVVTKFGKKLDIVMINVHDDEKTSVEAAKKILSQTGGILIQIENSNKRLISFIQNGKTINFDPNRMFTRKGIYQNLLRLNNEASKDAAEQVEQFALFVLKHIPSGTGTLVALHNNDQGRLSINSYTNGGEYEKNVRFAAKALHRDPDNFFLTTDSTIFSQLKSSGFNTVLQENNHADDDGSLSIYYGRLNKSYVNVEAEIGQLDEQAAMIDALVKMLCSRR